MRCGLGNTLFQKLLREFDGEIPQSRDIIWMLLRRNWSEPARRPGTVPRRLICPRLVSHLHIAGVFVCAFFGIFCI